MEIDKSKFCVVPFVQLNTRGKGDARVCCSIDGLDYGIPKNLTIDEMNSDTYTRKTDVFNLSKDTIDSLWNSKFMMDFRMKMINGESIPNCEFCFRMEKSGLTSKRLGKNFLYLDDTLPFLENYKKNQGYVDSKPKWWEIRLSTKCNLSCLMCAPGLSSMMLKEYEKWDRQGKLLPIMKGSLNIAKISGKDYLSKSDFFKNQILENLSHVSVMEFRGGEVFADHESIEFIRSIAETEHAKNISLDISTNATLLFPETIAFLNKFKGGTLRFSIDAHEELDEYIRYHTKWQSVLNSMRESRNLHKGWRFLTQTTVQMLNCLSMDRLVSFFDSFIMETQDQRFFLGFTTVRGKDFLRHEMVSNSRRNDQIKNLLEIKEKLPIFTEHPKKDIHLRSINMLIKTLQEPEYSDKELQKLAKSYFETLSDLRKVNYFEKFPHLMDLCDNTSDLPIN